METKDIPATPVPQLWILMDNKVDMAVIGKLGEEACEAGTAVCRCFIQGLDGTEPTTGKVNMDWLMDEVADMLAMAKLAAEHFNWPEEQLRDRRDRKYQFKKTWVEDLKAHFASK